MVALLCHTQPAPEWRAGSERIVEALVRDKFRRNAKAREVLLGTGRVKLVYTNTHDDRVWGVCGGESSSSSSSSRFIFETRRVSCGRLVYIYTGRAVASLGFLSLASARVRLLACLPAGCGSAGAGRAVGVFFSDHRRFRFRFFFFAPPARVVLIDRVHSWHRGDRSKVAGWRVFIAHASEWGGWTAQSIFFTCRNYCTTCNRAGPPHQV